MPADSTGELRSYYLIVRSAKVIDFQVLSSYIAITYKGQCWRSVPRRDHEHTVPLPGTSNILKSHWGMHEYYDTKVVTRPPSTVCLLVHRVRNGEGFKVYYFNGTAHC